MPVKVGLDNVYSFILFFMKASISFFSALIEAVQFIIRKKLFRYFIPSICLAILFYFIFSGGKALSNGISFMENWWLIGWMVKTSEQFFSFLSFFFFEFFILILLSPINAYLAEKTREDITGEKLDFSVAIFLKSLRRMLVILILAFIMQILLSFILWLLSFLLGETFFEIASLINIAFFIGFSFFDFALELDDINSRKSWRFARKNWISCVLIGLLFNIAIYYPQKHNLFIIYLIAISIIPNLLAIASSKMYHKKKIK